jgi:hypothetical protein
MTFKPAVWYPIAVVLSVINLFAAGLAARDAEPMHAGLHVALAVAFGLWARRLGQRQRGGELQVPLEMLEAVEALEADVSKLRQELSETQERLDFAERVLSQGAESRRMGPQP